MRACFPLVGVVTTCNSRGNGRWVRPPKFVRVEDSNCFSFHCFVKPVSFLIYNASLRRVFSKKGRVMSDDVFTEGNFYPFVLVVFRTMNVFRSIAISVIWNKGLSKGAVVFFIRASNVWVYCHTKDFSIY